MDIISISPNQPSLVKVVLKFEVEVDQTSVEHTNFATLHTGIMKTKLLGGLDKPTDVYANTHTSKAKSFVPSNFFCFIACEGKSKMYRRGGDKIEGGGITTGRGDPPSSLY